tara:strand:- start:9005 stop:9358 length:354 start_codon:yes stop_codon:yes gene_type:complete
MAAYRHPSQSPSRGHKTILILELPTLTVVKGRMIWRPLSSPPTRPSSKIRRAARYPPSFRPLRHLRQHRKQLEEDEVGYHERAEEEAYLYAAVQEAQEVAVALREVQRAEVVESADI